jgi:hypothetical protein
MQLGPQLDSSKKLIVVDAVPILVSRVQTQKIKEQGPHISSPVAVVVELLLYTPPVRSLAASSS